MHLMKNLVFALLVTLLFVQCSYSQDSQKRSSVLTKRAGNRNIFQKSTTTTTEANYEDEDYVDESLVPQEGEDDGETVEASSTTTTTTTTEVPKVLRPSVRPFRSNQELLSALKKRRLNEKNIKTTPITQKPAKEENIYEKPEVKTTKSKPTAASSFASGGKRRFGGHKSTNAKAPVQDNFAQAIEEQPTSKPFKRSNKFTLRPNP